MTQLLGPNGKPISSKMYENKKAPPPRTGPSYGQYAGEDMQFMNLPGGGAIQFDLNQLGLGDFRQMREHYQVNSSLTVLTFLMHQMEWVVEVDANADQKTFYNEQVENQWTALVRAHATSFWAGYGSNALEFDNDVTGRRFVIDKIKDLVPEDCRVRWKKIDGAGNQKFNVYDGIRQFGAEPIPVENSYWYPLLMENGNYYGRKLLKPAFQPWFFSILLHLFANRYYERFGEPTPVGRAPYDDDLKYQGQEMKGDQAMELILQSLRSRATVVLPDSRTPLTATDNNSDYDYTIEYLESQMRGADFERYMTRLDEEISLALFTPILLMRTADVGSYNLGTQHSIIYQWLLNAISGDWATYINKYILRPLRDYNFGTNAALPRIKFRRMGAQNQELVNQLIIAMTAKGTAKPDVVQLGEMAGISMKAAKAITAPPPAPAADPNAPPDPNAPVPPDPNAGKNVRTVANQICDRINDQVEAGYRRNKLHSMTFSTGFQRQMDEAFASAGVWDSFETTKVFFFRIENILQNMVDISNAYDTPKIFMDQFRKAVAFQVDHILDEVL